MPLLGFGSPVEYSVLIGRAVPRPPVVDTGRRTGRFVQDHVGSMLPRAAVAQTGPQTWTVQLVVRAIPRIPQFGGSESV